MAKNIVIDITNGQGIKEIQNGDYNVTVESTGYNSESLSPKTVSIVDGQEIYEFTLSASGSLTFHVTEDGTQSGTSVEGAVFYRCDSTGITYGNPITTDSSGIATLPNLPYATESSPIIYYKQVETEETHNFDDTIKSITLTQESTTLEVQNAKASEKTITLKDENYEGLYVERAQITLSN